MSLKSNARLLVKLSALMCANAYALDPESVKLADGITFTPTLKVSERYDDNFRQVEHGTESSWITGIAPKFVLAAKTSKSLYRLSYEADTDLFHSSPKDNNTDHYLDGEAVFKFDSRNRLKLDGGYEKVEDTAAQDQHVQNDRYTIAHSGAKYTYGAPTARGQIEVGGDYSELRYQNSGGINDYKERNTTALVSTFYYRVAPKTRALVEARYTDFRYVSNTQLNSNNVALLGGLTWKATAKTTGTIKIGGEQKRFDDSSLGNKSGSLWEAGVSWSPKTYSTFGLTTRHQIDEGSDGSSSIEDQTSTVNWEHHWLQRLSTEIHYSHSSLKYQDIVRDDTVDQYGLGVKYNMRRWLDIGLSYTRAKDDSTADDQSYTRNIYMISVTAGL
jgi:hypothetical protein